MRKLVMAAVATLMMSFVAAPSAVAQETEKEANKEYAEKAEKMEKEAKEAHWMKGTMTPPGQAPIDIKYAFTKGEDGPKGWIVAEDDGETIKIEMSDLSWDDDYVSYNWSPDEASVLISCNLQKQEDGSYAGDCTDDSEAGATGQMTIAPMEKKEKSEG
jgi:hypothetical protein